MRWETLRPQWGFVLGSGLGSFVEQLSQVAAVPYAMIEGMPVSKAPGHEGRFEFARIGGVMTVIASGRCHLYEGRTAQEVTAGIRWMHSRGVERVVLTNAAGSCNRMFAPGSWMMLEDHLNLTGTSPLEGGPNFVDMTGLYSPALRTHFGAAAQKLEVKLHRGIYAGLRGPQYETPAEVQMIRSFGADAIGMSTVLEAIQARALGLEVAAFSCLTNWAAGLAPGSLSHEDVLATGKRAAAELAKVLLEAIPSLK